MKKIRNIHDLEYEKLKLRVKQLELEKQIDRSWKRLSSKLSSTDLNGQKHSTQSDFKTGNTLLSGALNYGASFLSHKLGILAGKKVETTAEQMLGKLAEKINSLGARKKKFQKS
jgi:hypothetical protein